MGAVPILFCALLPVDVFYLASATIQVTICNYLNQQITSEMTE
jgi:hypothetical protein